MNRENWLMQAVGELRPVFEAAGHPLPDSVRVTCGFPSTARRSGTLGETWSPADSADGATEIMVSPVLAAGPDVLAVLLAQSRPWMCWALCLPRASSLLLLRPA